MSIIVSDYIVQIASAFFSLLQELGFHFFLGLVVCAAILAVRRTPLGGITAIVCAALFPACNFAAPSLAAGIAFRRRCATVAAIAFLVATLVSPAALAYVVGVFGWLFAVVYIVMAALAAVVLWLLSRRFEDEGDCGSGAVSVMVDEAGSAWFSASRPLLFLKEAAPRVAAAVLLGAAVFSILTPVLGQVVQGVLARTPLFSAGDVIAVALGMHFCSPDDFALVALVAQSGLPIGAAAVLMFLGPLANIPEVFALAALVGKKRLLAYLAAAVSATASFGAVAELLAAAGVVGGAAPIDAGSFVAVVNQAAIATPPFLAMPCAIALLILGLYGFFLMARPQGKPDKNGDPCNEG